jgi:hypothetical protein
MTDGAAPRCPACGAMRLEQSAPNVVRCGHCATLFDAYLQPLPPMHGASIIEELPTNPPDFREDAEVTWMRLDPADEAETDPRAPHVPLGPPGPAQVTPERASFAPPPPPGPFAPPPTKEALERASQKRTYSRAVGDGGPPHGLDTLVMILAGMNILSLGLWARSTAAIGNVYMLPLTLSIIVVYFFWQGKNWARFVLMALAMVEIVIVGFAFAVVRRELTAPEMLSAAAKLALDVYLLYFCVRPDSVAFYERRSGRVSR